MRPVKLICTDEYDAITGARHYHIWRPGQRKAVKRRLSRRERRAIRANLRMKLRRQG